ncbi:hypothetical protein M9H77_35482 [Catharanthus roseus]|uniref:Uncharacterized protein n=1 Tax=Catharanthus roseus TaxID=4058 RepID=A0ACB9ZP41_CATRO|nr:hypothetical protein M9H77_35482 [Catharanthus roseus]
MEGRLSDKNMNYLPYCSGHARKQTLRVALRAVLKKNTLFDLSPMRASLAYSVATDGCGLLLATNPWKIRLLGPESIGLTGFILKRCKAAALPLQKSSHLLTEETIGVTSILGNYRQGSNGKTTIGPLSLVNKNY